MLAPDQYMHARHYLFSLGPTARALPPYMDNGEEPEEGVDVDASTLHNQNLSRNNQYKNCRK